MKLGTTEREALRLLFSPDGGPMQDIVTREIARLAASAAAASAATLGSTPAGRFVANAAQQQHEAFTAAMGASGTGSAGGIPAAGIPAEGEACISVPFLVCLSVTRRAALSSCSTPL